MKCSNCGFENDSGYKFCGRCGNQLNVNEPKVLRLKCQNCNGVMDVDEDKMIAFCPYCGSKNLIIESDVVRVERIKSKTALGKEEVHRNMALDEQEFEMKKMQFEEEVSRKDSRALVLAFLAGLGLLLLLWILGVR